MRKYKVFIASVLAALVYGGHANAASVTLFGPLADLADPNPSLSFDISGLIVVPDLANASMLLQFESSIRFELSLLDPAPNDGITPAAAYTAGTSVSIGLFRDGVAIPFDRSGGNAGVNAINCIVSCENFSTSFGTISTSPVLQAGDIIQLVGTVSGGAGWGISEAPAELDFITIESTYTTDLMEFFGDPLPPVPLPPALWLFLSALALLGVRLRFTRRNDS